jgi:hypothetical protein
MTPWPDVRRHSDGSIDFDFYRRQQPFGGGSHDSAFSSAV